MLRYEIRRYGSSSYGESIFSAVNLKDCLKYLKDIFTNNGYSNVERYDFTFIANNRLYRIYKAKV